MLIVALVCVVVAVKAVAHLRSGRNARTNAKLKALVDNKEAKERCAKLDRENAVLRAHNQAFDRRRIIGDRLIPDILEETGEDIGFVCDVLDRAYKWARETL
jgi:hypothetical protein